MRPSSTAVPSLEAVTELPVAAIIHTVAPGEAACSSHAGLTVGMQLGPSAIDLRLECQSRQYDSRYVPGDLTCIPPGAAHGYRHRVHTPVAHLSIDPGFVDQIFGARKPILAMAAQRAEVDAALRSEGRDLIAVVRGAPTNATRFADVVRLVQKTMKPTFAPTQN